MKPTPSSSPPRPSTSRRRRSKRAPPQSRVRPSPDPPAPKLPQPPWTVEAVQYAAYGHLAHYRYSHPVVEHLTASLLRPSSLAEAYERQYGRPLAEDMVMRDGDDEIYLDRESEDEEEEEEEDGPQEAKFVNSTPEDLKRKIESKRRSKCTQPEYASSSSSQVPSDTVETASQQGLGSSPPGEEEPYLPMQSLLVETARMATEMGEESNLFASTNDSDSSQDQLPASSSPQLPSGSKENFNSSPPTTDRDPEDLALTSDTLGADKSEDIPSSSSFSPISTSSNYPDALALSSSVLVSSENEHSSSSQAESDSPTPKAKVYKEIVLFDPELDSSSSPDEGNTPQPSKMSQHKPKPRPKSQAKSKSKSSPKPNPRRRRKIKSSSPAAVQVPCPVHSVTGPECSLACNETKGAEMGWVLQDKVDARILASGGRWVVLQYVPYKTFKGIDLLPFMGQRFIGPFEGIEHWGGFAKVATTLYGPDVPGTDVNVYVHVTSAEIRYIPKESWTTSLALTINGWKKLHVYILLRPSSLPVARHDVLVCPAPVSILDVELPRPPHERVEFASVLTQADFEPRTPEKGQ